MKKHANDESRRQWLKKMALGGAVGAVATVASGQVLAATPESASDADKGDGYRETDHVRRYYASLRG